MFRQVHRRLTLLCAGITILVLILMSCSYLYISEKNLKETSFTSFQNDMNTLLSNLENQTIITHEWLSKMEGNGKYFLSIRDNGQPFLWGNQEHGLAYREALKAGWDYYDTHSGDFPAARPFTIQHREFSFSSNGDRKEDYFGCIAFSSRDTGTLTILILESTEYLQERILTQRHTFLILVLSAALVLAFFSYLFTGLLLQPLKKSRQSQIQFVAAASHELRTPLSVILSAGNACRKASPQEQGMFLDIIKKEGEAMSRLISDLLTLAGADSHSFAIRPAPCEPDTLLLDLFEASQLLAREKGYHLSIQLPEEKTTPLICDSDRIRQVLSILLHNAFSFCPSGSRITISLRQQDKTTFFTVSDNGPGIPDTIKAHLFDRFYRGDASRQDSGHFGLGLSIAREIMEAHHGTITVSDSPGGGATFTASLGSYRKKP
nr:HAMP domain-containing sensor histidine kinase [uncultured Eisenbergiella sp.]